MLVLSRKDQQRTLIQIPGPAGQPVKIWVTVIQSMNNKVRLGFDAPPEVLILREEVIDRAGGWPAQS